MLETFKKLMSSVRKDPSHERAERPPHSLPVLDEGHGGIRPDAGRHQAHSGATLFALLGFLILAQSTGSLHAQTVVDRARRDVDMLTSPALAGRGFSGDGHRAAAAFLQDRFESTGLHALPSGFLLPFEFEVDVFDDAPALRVSGRTLEPGIDFLPHGASASGRSEGRIRVRSFSPLGEPDTPEAPDQPFVAVFAETIPESLSTGILPDLRRLESRITRAAAFGPIAIFVLTERLTFGMSPLDAPIPVFVVRSEAWPAGAAEVEYEVTSRRNVHTRAFNVVGAVPGTVRPDSILVVTAHYDHLGALGDSLYFPGANDNAGGVALLLALADTVVANPLPYTTVFIAFSAEEQGLVGSIALASAPPFPLENIRFLLNLDMVTSGERGVVAVGGADFPEEYALLEQIAARLGAPRLGKRPSTPISDHYPFFARGVRSFYLYTTHGKQPYHHIHDVPETLEWDDFLEVYNLALEFLGAIAGQSTS